VFKEPDDHQRPTTGTLALPAAARPRQQVPGQHFAGRVERTCRGPLSGLLPERAGLADRTALFERGGQTQVNAVRLRLQGGGSCAFCVLVHAVGRTRGWPLRG